MNRTLWIFSAALISSSSANAQKWEQDVTFSRETLELIEKLTESNPEVLAGVTLDDEAAVATVYRVRGREEEGRELVRNASKTPPSPAAVSVQYHDVEHSWSDLTRIRDAAPDTAKWFAELGATLSRVYIDPYSNTVRYGVTHLTDELRAKVDDRWSSAVTLEETPLATRTFGRHQDTEPFASGAYIRSSVGPNTWNICTAGLVAEKVSGPFEPWFMYTAGHCFGLNSEIATPPGVRVGKILNRSFTNWGFDIATINGENYYPGIYTGGPMSFTYSDVVGRRDPVVGSVMCTSGSQSGESCSWKLQFKNSCELADDNIFTCFLNGLKRNSAIVIGGDSGGPVFIRDSTTSAYGLYGVGVNIMTYPANPGQWLLYHPIGFVLPSGWDVATW